MPSVGEQECSYPACTHLAEIETIWCHEHEIEFECWCDEFTDDRPCND